MIGDARRHIERAAVDDFDAIAALLETSHLPLDGLREHLATALVARQNGTIVGSAALEVYPDGALLRSVAVSPGQRGSGLGHALTSAAIRMAEDLRVPAMYLLTTTADQYFPKFDFERIERSDVPPSVQASVEFASACPSSAVVMRKRLTTR
jgi:amino-acid N-acetyltransferase